MVVKDAESYYRNMFFKGLLPLVQPYATSNNRSSTN